MARLYTGGGDRGTTSLWDGTRVDKDDPRIGLNGVLDETQSALGLARSFAPDSLKQEIEILEKKLFSLMAYIARGDRECESPVPEELESWIDRLESKWPHKREFVHPGESRSGAALHLARSIARRAEREALPLYREGVLSDRDVKYVNRLSDLIYALALACDSEEAVFYLTSKVVEKLAITSGNLMTLDRALSVIEIAKSEAVKIGVPMVISVYDSFAALVALERMDDSLPISLELSQKKAKTAISLRMSTEEVSRAVQPGASLYGLQEDPDLCCFGGGTLLKREGHIMGAIGISGGSVEQDTAVADSTVSIWAEN